MCQTDDCHVTLEYVSQMIVMLHWNVSDRVLSHYIGMCQTEYCHVTLECVSQIIVMLHWNVSSQIIVTLHRGIISER